MRVVDLYCGAGGASLGAHLAGHEVVLAVDHWHTSTTGRRRLTVSECAVLQGFPVTYPWQGTKTHQYRQVGNACPPLLVAAVLRSV